MSSAIQCGASTQGLPNVDPVYTPQMMAQMSDAMTLLDRTDDYWVGVFCAEGPDFDRLAHRLNDIGGKPRPARQAGDTAELARLQAAPLPELPDVYRKQPIYYITSRFSVKGPNTTVKWRAIAR